MDDKVTVGLSLDLPIALFGGKTAALTLLFIAANQEGYAAQIAKALDMGIGQVQRQLWKLEANDILLARSVGRTRLFRLNTRLSIIQELEKLLRRAIDDLPREQRERLLVRFRPRKTGKPLPKNES